MKKILLAVAVMMSVNSYAQSDYEVSKDKENGAVVYKGECTFTDLQKEPTFAWVEKDAAAYTPDTNAIKYLKKHLPDYDFVVLMGTWCDDTHMMLPKYYKVLQATNYPMTKLKMYGVDRAKTTKNIEHRLYKLVNVPTIIVIRNHMEIGRIVETTKKSVEVDLIAMIQKDIEAREAKQ